MKVAIIGAGNVGAMTASRVIDANLADVVLVDIIHGLAKGKALDISDSRPILGSTSQIIGSEDFKDIEGAEIVVITAGLARTPGMSREDLLKKNALIIKDISNQIKKWTISPIVIVVTNPLDIMSYLVMKTTGFQPCKIIGMAGVLDTARFINILSEQLKVKGWDSYKDKLFMLGSHGDTMVAINRYDGLSESIFSEASKRAKNRGEEIVRCLKSGSAYFAPSSAVFYMLKFIINNEKTLMCASVYLQGEYGENGIFIGVPVILDRTGVREIVKLDLNDSEMACFRKSARSIREGIGSIKENPPL